MCVDALSRWLPCTETNATVRYEADHSSCSSAMRIALSIASIAIGILSTTLFLATNDLIALGVTVALGIAAICLWPKRGGGGERDLPPQARLLHVHNAFENAFPPPAVPYAEPYRDHSFFMPQPPFGGVVSYAPSESRVRVGDGRSVMAPMMGAPTHGIPRGGEDRIPVGTHGREPFHHVAPPPPHYEAPPIGRGIYGGMAQSGGGMMGPPQPPHPVVHPRMPPPPISNPGGEQRISVGRGGHVGAEPQVLSGEDRVPVGRSHRK